MSTTNHTSHSHPEPAVTATTSMTSRSTSSARFTQRPNVETETPKHKTLNNAPVPTNEVLNTTCKYSVNHAPSHTSHRSSSGKQDHLSKGLKRENQHTRMTLGTLSWVYKASDYLMVIGPGSPCWSYQSQDPLPAKTARRRDAFSSAKM